MKLWRGSDWLHPHLFQQSAVQNFLDKLDFFVPIGDAKHSGYEEISNKFLYTSFSKQCVQRQKAEEQ